MLERLAITLAPAKAGNNKKYSMKSFKLSSYCIDQT